MKEIKSSEAGHVEESLELHFFLALFTLAGFRLSFSYLPAFGFLLYISTPSREKLFSCFIEFEFFLLLLLDFMNISPSFKWFLSRAIHRMLGVNESDGRGRAR
jgi:hypothetical protein